MHTHRQTLGTAWHIEDTEGREGDERQCARKRKMRQESEIKEEGDPGERSVDPYPGGVIHGEEEVGEQGAGVIAWCGESETEESG